MKKVMFLQINSHSFGGIWEVNHTLGEEFIKRGYSVSMLAIRQNHPGVCEKVSSDFKINSKSPLVKWGALLPVLLVLLVILGGRLKKCFPALFFKG